MEQVKFSNLNVANMLAYLSNANIKEPSVIDITRTKMNCRAFPSTKKYVKNTSIDLNLIMDIGPELPPEVDLIKFPVYKFQNLINILKIYDESSVDKLSGKIRYNKTPSNGYIGFAIEFESKQMNVKSNAMDFSLLPYLDEEKWNKMKVADEYICAFDMTSALISKLSKLSKVDSVSESMTSSSKDMDVIILVEVDKEKGLVFKSNVDKWSYAYTQEEGNIEIKAETKLQLIMASSVLDRMDSKFYKCKILKNDMLNHHVLLTEENEENIMLNMMEIYDKAIHSNQI